MKKIKIIFLVLMVLMNSIFAAGCWNYKEVDQFSIVAGVAVDIGKNSKYELTAELIQISGGKEAKTTSKTVTVEGKTIFDAARNMISISGKKLYWSHAKVIILSKEAANNGVKNAIEWYTRDSETRESVYVLISKGETAKEIFDGQGTTESIMSFILQDIIKNQMSLSKSSVTDILKYSIESQQKGASTIIPAVSLKLMNDKMVPEVIGTAIIKNDKLAGFLNGEETKDLSFIRNEVKGGVLVEEMQVNNLPAIITLEIFNSKTKVSFSAEAEDLVINIDIDTTVAIDEVEGTVDLSDEKEINRLKQITENTIKERIETLIIKIKSEYDADIFCFGIKLWQNNPQVWKSVKNNWEDVLSNAEVNVKTNVHIKNSAIVS